jgi:DNA-binding HxlR family transcriptional regulator
MPSKDYEQFCGLARTLDVVGDRWNLLIVRELLTGPKRNADLRAGLPGIATNLLSDRLGELQEAGVLERRELPTPAPAVVYELTDRGRALKGAILELARWGRPLLGARRAKEAFSPRWLLLSLEASFDPTAAGDEEEVYEFRVDGEVIHASIRDGTVSVADGPAPAPNAAVEADAETLLAWGTGSLDDAGALRAGMRVSGGRSTLRRLGALFPPGR